MINKLLITLLVILNLILFSFIVGYGFFARRNVKPLQLSDSVETVIKILKKNDKILLDKSTHYLLLTFVGSCDDAILKQLSNYLAIEEEQKPFIKMAFIYAGSDYETVSACEGGILSKNFISGKYAKEVVNLLGIPNDHAATFILDLRTQMFLTNYNYLLESTILKELIEVIPR
jgi:hypothetical protein